jgi:AcrR family transcriptional regulator
LRLKHLVVFGGAGVLDTHTRGSALRDRLLTAAHDLFHRYGVRGVGVDAIAEAAGTNKMTLYRYFASKDELITAYVRAVAAEVEAMWDGIEHDNPDDGEAQLKSWLICADTCLGSDQRGCDLVNAAVELTEKNHPARRLIEEIKTESRNRLVKFCRNAHVSQPEMVADTLTLLFEGARASIQSAGAKGPGAKFAVMAENVIKTAERKPKADRKTTRKK